MGILHKLYKQVLLSANKKKLLLILSVVLVVNIYFTGATAVSDATSNENTSACQIISFIDRSKY